jgi:hypothetical protein
MSTWERMKDADGGTLCPMSVACDCYLGAIVEHGLVPLMGIRAYAVPEELRDNKVVEVYLHQNMQFVLDTTL